MHILFGLVFVVGGIVKAVWPEFGFRWSERKYKDEREPSEDYLGMQRLVGIGTIVLGILVMVGACGMVE